MKRSGKYICFQLAICAALTLIPTGKASAQIEIIEEIIKRAIMAVDLRVQKLQTRTIFLQEIQKQLESIMQQSQLSDIADWMQHQQDLFNEYYSELWQVKSVLSWFDKSKEIIEKQAHLVLDLKKAYASFRIDPHFSVTELYQINQTLTGILDQSIRNISQLSIIVSSLATQMSDGDRLYNIDLLSEKVDRNYKDLQQYSQENIVLSLQRSKDQQDFHTIKMLYGLQ